MVSVCPRVVMAQELQNLEEVATFFFTRMTFVV